jgi:hypothetical protein
MSETQFYKILNCKFKEYIVWLDADAKKEAILLAQRLSEFGKAYVIFTEKDPDVYRNQMKEIIDGAKEYSDSLYAEFVLEELCQ